jgi:aspartate carbamoyltransferase catalytic subunit
VRIIAPRTLIPTRAEEALGVRVFHDLREGMRDADVIILLRLQRERMDGGFLPSEHEYFPPVRPHRKAPARGQARRHRHAPRPDQPRRRDGLQVADGRAR